VILLIHFLKGGMAMFTCTGQARWTQTRDGRSYRCGIEVELTCLSKPSILFFNVFLTVLDSVESVGNPGQVLDIQWSQTADDTPVLTASPTLNQNQQFFLRRA
jgi:hypothetical protein